MFTLLKEFWMVPLLFALSMLVVWFIARLWKRNSAKPSIANRSESRSSVVLKRPDDIPAVNSPSLSGMEARDFQTLNPRTSKTAKTRAINDSSLALAARDMGEASSDFAHLNEVDERELTDRSFDDPDEDLEPIVFPRPPEPALVLSNESLRQTVNTSRPTAPRNVAAKPATHYRRDRGESINQTARNLSLPPRVPRASQLQVESESDSPAKSAPPIEIAPAGSPLREADETFEPPTFTPKYIFAAHPFLATWPASLDPQDEEDSVKQQETSHADDEAIEPSDLEIAFAQLESEHRKLRTEFEEATKSVAALQTERDELQIQRDMLQAERDDLNTRNARIEILDADLAEAQQHCDSLRSEIAGLRDQLGQLESNKLQAETNLARLHGELQAKDSDLIRLQYESGVAQQQLDTLSQQLAERVEQAAQAAELIKQKDALQTRVAAMTQQLQTEKDERFELAITKTTLESSLAALTNQLAQKESERRRFAADLELATNALKQATQQQTQLETEIRATESRVAELQTAASEAEKLHQENQHLMQQLAAEGQTIANQLEMVRRDQVVAVSERNRFVKEVAQAETRVANLQADCQAHLELVNQLNAEKVELLRQLEELKRKPGFADDLTRISGIGKVLAGKLHGAGISTFEQIMNWDQPTIEQLNATLRLQGRIQRDKWIEQAARLFREAKEAGKE